MKIKLVFAALLLALLSSCAYKTCPTYSQQGDAQVEEVAVKVKL
jgi:hypothetical protein